MPSGPYLYERQVEYWTSREIEGFFLDTGFEVLVLPISQLTEKDVPADFLFLDGRSSKLFGLQYKTLYHNNEDFWHLDQGQYGALQAFDWMYYGLSDLKSARQYRNALHYLRIVEGSIPYEEHLTRRHFQQQGFPRFLRWAAFFEGVCDCKYGRRITTREDLRHALWPHSRTPPREISEIANEIFLTDFQNRRTARFSSLLRGWEAQ
jgi:hypothetical protein